MPITDEKAPKDADFDLLLARCWRAPPGAALFFNCQMGRGRTTTGMAIAAMVCLRKVAGSGPRLPRGGVGGGGAGGGGGAPPLLPPWFASAPKAPAPPPSSSASEIGIPPPPPDAHLLAGRYAAVRSLLRALPGGSSAKAALDAVLDASGAMQNLREAVAGYRARLAAEPDDDKRSDLLRVALEYLERYCVLIVFATYLAGPSADPDGGVVVVVEEAAAAAAGAGARAAGAGARGGGGGGASSAVVGASLAPFRRPPPPLAPSSLAADPGATTPAAAATSTRRRVPHEPFADWMRSRPELRSVLARMLRRNPLAALELHHHLEGSGDEGGRGAGGAAAAAAGGAPRRGGSARSAASSPSGKEGDTPRQHTQTEDEDSFSLDDEGDALSSAALDASAALVAGRRGAVLGPQTILKEDHYPGCQAPRLRAAAAAGGGGGSEAAAASAAAAAAAATAAAGGVAPVRGAPNFRRVPGGAHVYGGGTPTEDGVRGVLSAVLDAEEADRKAKRKETKSSGGGGGGGGGDRVADGPDGPDEASLPPCPSSG